MFHTNGHVDFYNCSFNDHRARPISIWHSFSVTIHSSTFVNKSSSLSAVGGGSFIRLTRVRRVCIIGSSFNTSQSGRGGCVRCQNVGSIFIERCSFVLCHAENTGGALFFRNTMVKTIVRDSKFTKNTVKKAGGAICFPDERTSKSEPTLITKCIFVDNEAGAVGQAIYSRVTLRMQNISIFAKEKQGAFHVQLEGGLITLGNIKLVTETHDIIQSGVTWRGINVMSDDLKIDGLISQTCPQYFNVKTYNTWVVKLRSSRKWDDFYTSFESKCVSCPPNQYSIYTGKLDVYPYLKVKLSKRTGYP